MSNMEKTPRETVEKMYQDYQNYVPVRVIARRYSLTPSGVYWLFEREGFPRDMLKKIREG